MAVDPVTIGTGVTVLDTVLSGKAAKDAAETNTDAIYAAMEISEAAAKQAREDIIAAFGPSYEAFTTGIKNAEDLLINGQKTTTDILFDTADEVLKTYAQGTADARADILGIPRATIETPGAVDGTEQPGQPETGETKIKKEGPGAVGIIQPSGYMDRAGIEDLGASPELVQAQRELEAAQKTGIEGIPTKSDTRMAVGVAAPAPPATGPVNIPSAESLDILDGIQEISDATGIDPQDIFYSGMTAQQIIDSASQITQGIEPSVLTDIFGQLNIGNAPPVIPDVNFNERLSGITQPIDTKLPNEPQYGLTGFESAITGGRTEASSALSAGSTAARGDLETARARGLDILNRAIQVRDVGGDPGKALQQIQGGVEGAVGELGTFRERGEQALNLEAAFSGALGQEAQAKAFQDFQESAGQQYFRERQEQALLRNASALGGIGGGKVRTALQEQAFGIAAQQQQQQIENLRALSQIGLSAATSQGQFRMQGGIAGGQVVSDIEKANIASRTGIEQQRIAETAGNQRAAAALEQATGMSLSELSFKTGLSQAELITRASEQIAGARSEAGVALGGLTERETAAKAGVIGGLGSGVAGITGQTATNIANLEQQQGAGTADLITGLGTTSANIATGAGSQASNLTQAAGASQAAGILGQSNIISGGVNDFMSMLIAGSGKKTGDIG